MSRKKHRRVWEYQGINMEAAAPFELTGLMPTVPNGEEEWKSYLDIQKLASDETPDPGDPDEEERE